MKIIAFAFAGGSQYSFQKYSQNLPKFVVVEYPGRGNRINEQLIDDIDLLIEDLLPRVIHEIDSCNEYIIYGHSMGALVGYLICQRISEIQIRQPLKLVVSGKKSPSIKRENLVAHLPNNHFWNEVIKLGGIPIALEKNVELMEFYIPILKADFNIIENYNYVKKAKLKIPIAVFYGTEEKITEEEIIGWKTESIKDVIIEPLNGNHFFIYNHEQFFINYFKKINLKLNCKLG